MHLAYMQSVTEKQIEQLAAEIPKSVGAQIVFFRNKQKLSQSRLAEMVGKDRQYIYKIEKGKVTPNITTLSIIAKALNISLSTLFAEVKI